MTFFLFVFSLLKHLSILAAAYCGLSHHSLYSILIMSAVVLALQAIELKDLTFIETRPFQNPLLLKLKAVFAFVFPSVAFISFSYFAGLVVHTFS